MLRRPPLHVQRKANKQMKKQRRQMNRTNLLGDRLEVVGVGLVESSEASGSLVLGHLRNVEHARMRDQMSRGCARTSKPKNKLLSQHNNHNLNHEEKERII
jgi:hypothetical protein